MSKPGSLSEILNTIQNGCAGHKSHVNCSWPSKLSLEVLKKLYKEGYIRGFVPVSVPAKPAQTKHAIILLKYTVGQRPTILDIKRAPLGGKRVWVGVEHLRAVAIRAAALSDPYTAFLSTSKGVLTLNEALKLRCGGELLFSLKT